MEQINLNTIPGIEMYPIIHVSQGDVGRQFKINLYNDEGEVVLDGTESLSITGYKADGNVFIYNLPSVTGSELTISTEEQMTAAKGECICEISVVKGTTKIGTANFIMQVEANPSAQGPLSTSALDVIDALLQSAHEDIETASSAASTATTAATNAANSASSAATHATNAAEAAATALRVEVEADEAVSTANTAASNAATYASNAASSASAAADSQLAAAQSQSSAAASASDASTSATNAASSASDAADSATNAANSATSASNSATNAANSASAANTSASSAASSASDASDSATAAATSASSASTSASDASDSATSAAQSEQSASTSASAASTSATSAVNSATAASNSASSAADSATAAATSATNASNSASSASTSATNAATSASEASTSATNAASSESNAATSESNAHDSELAAAASASSASSSATSASTSATNAAASETKIANMTVSAQSVSYNEEAEVVKTVVGDVYNLDFKIPKGQPMSGHEVEANPSGAATSDLTKLGIDGTIYNLAGGGAELLPIDIRSTLTASPVLLMDGNDNVIKDFRTGAMQDYTYTAENDTVVQVMLENINADIDSSTGNWVITEHRPNALEGKMIQVAESQGQNNQYKFAATTQPIIIRPADDQSPFDLGAKIAYLPFLPESTYNGENISSYGILVNNTDVSFSYIDVKFCYDNYVDGEVVDHDIKLFECGNINLHTGDVLTIQYDWINHSYRMPSVEITNVISNDSVGFRGYRNTSSTSPNITDYPNF